MDMWVADIMMRRPVTGTPEMTINRAATVLRRGRFRHLPVLRDGRLYGVFSDRDLQRAIAAGMPGTAAIAPLVHSPPITATPDTPIEHVARLMRENKIGCVPIVGGTPREGEEAARGYVDGTGGNGEALVGIVTESDVFEALVRALAVAAPGSRLVVWLDDPRRDLLRVAGVLSAQCAPILSLVTEPLPAPDAGSAARPRAVKPPSGEGPLRLAVRLGTIDPRPVARALRDAGLVVETPASEREAA